MKIFNDLYAKLDGQEVSEDESKTIENDVKDRAEYN